MKKLIDSKQMNFFTNNNDMQVSPPLIKSLLDVLGKFNLVPTFGQEFNPATGEQRQIISMLDPNQKFKVEFPAGMIGVSGVNMEDEEFVSKASDVLKSLKGLFPNKKGTRLAILNARVYQADVEVYDVLYKKIFTYHAVTPFEWDSRIAVKDRLDAFDEEINSISTIKRGMVQLVPAFFTNFSLTANDIDTITFEVDSNTHYEDARARFDLEGCAELLKALALKNSIMNQEVRRYTEAG